MAVRQYFERNPVTDIKDHTLVGLFYTNPDLSDGVLRQLPTELVNSDYFKGIIDRRPRIDLGRYNINNVPLEDLQFVALIANVDTFMNALSILASQNVRGYVVQLDSIITMWNKYTLDTYSNELAKMIDIFVRIVISGNDVFWSNRDDPGINAINARIFPTDSIKINEENKERVEKFKADIAATVARQKPRLERAVERKRLALEAEKKRVLEEEGKELPDEYNIGDAIFGVKVDAIQPLPMANYFADITQGEYTNMMTTAVKISTDNNSNIAISLFCAEC